MGWLHGGTAVWQHGDMGLLVGLASCWLRRGPSPFCHPLPPAAVSFLSRQADLCVGCPDSRLKSSLNAALSRFIFPFRVVNCSLRPASAFTSRSPLVLVDRRWLALYCRSSRSSRSIIRRTVLDLLLSCPEECRHVARKLDTSKLEHAHSQATPCPSPRAQSSYCRETLGTSRALSSDRGLALLTIFTTRSLPRPHHSS